MSAIETGFQSVPKQFEAQPCAPWPFPPFAPETLLSAEEAAAGLCLRESSGDAWRETATLIRERFAEAYGARIHHFMPRLFALRAREEAACSAVGVREAGRAPLFLERYLDTSIETAIATAIGQPVSRADVVEVGQFVGTSAGAFRCMIRLLTARLHAEDHRWVAFTGTRALRNAFARLGLSPQLLGPADPARLSLVERADWGSYYENAPQVMFGDIGEGFRRMAAEAAR